MLLEGYIEFENPIPVAMECLGKEYPIKVAETDGFLSMPLRYEGFEKKELGSLLAPKSGNVKFIDKFDWGGVYHYPSGKSRIQACKIIFPNIDESIYEGTGKKIARELKSWRNLLIDNISLELQVDFRRKVRSVGGGNCSGIGEFALFKRHSGSNNRFLPDEFGTRPILKIIISEPFGFSKKELQKLLDTTSSGKVLLLPFYFFFDAERARLEKNNRKSVLDSATAVEVCFSLLVGKLLPNDNDLNKYILSKHNSARQMRELLKTLKVALPIVEKEYVTKLDQVRNKVIHAGYNPTPTEVDNALKIANKTLYSLLPQRYKE